MKRKKGEKGTQRLRKNKREKGVKDGIVALKAVAAYRKTPLVGQFLDPSLTRVFTMNT